MGTTCASFHALWRGSVDDAARAISRAYTKLGYERLKKPPVEGGKQVILLARASERYVSVFDSTNADLDSGELKDAALAASKRNRGKRAGNVSGAVEWEGHKIQCDRLNRGVDSRFLWRSISGPVAACRRLILMVCPPPR